MKPMLTADELIVHMKSKGITFSNVSEDSAKAFLSSNNYYMKLSSYRFNYSKDDSGQYQKLDFAYLQDLSTIDMHLRYFVLEMCLDIEHYVKVRLINNVCNNPEEDGYELIKKFLSEGTNINILKSISSHKAGGYCKGLIEKYYPYFPVWVFVELISFNDLMSLCAFYEKKYGVNIVNNSLMNIIRDLRNASAHSNCLLNKLTEQMDATKQPHNEITEFVKSMPNISKSSRRKYLRSQFVYDFVTLLYVYDEFATIGSRKNKFKLLQTFMNDRVKRNSSFYSNHSAIHGTYVFLNKIIDNLANRDYTCYTIEK